jgi:hypothetical protein
MQRRHKNLIVALAMILIALTMPRTSRAAVAVISNRAPVEIRFSVVVGNAQQNPPKPKIYSVEPNDLVVVEVPRGKTAHLTSDAGAYEIQPDAAYYFRLLGDNKLNLSQIALTAPVPVAGEPLVAAGAMVPPKPVAEAERARTISVKIFVDDEEATRPAIWSRRFRGRIAAASDILQKHCGIGLNVVDVGSWNSDNNIHDFDLAVAEFVKEANPGKASLAIGFSSQYHVPRGRTHLGGTRGPLQRHILLREWSQHASESEKLELLVHELGHHLGATHSPERDAVMRPLLVDRQARAKQFIIHFDPLNTLAMNLVAEEIRDRGVQQFTDLTLPTKHRLSAIYSEIDKALPEDPAAMIYLRRLGLPQPAAR